MSKVPFHKLCLRPVLHLNEHTAQKLTDRRRPEPMGEPCCSRRRSFPYSSVETQTVAWHGQLKLGFSCTKPGLTHCIWWSEHDHLPRPLMSGWPPRWCLTECSVLHLQSWTGDFHTQLKRCLRCLQLIVYSHMCPIYAHLLHLRQLCSCLVASSGRRFSS